MSRIGPQLKPRGLVVCVDYSDTLAITLPSNMRHISECWVITSPTDRATLDLCDSVPNVHTYVTDEFYRDGAHFNKGLAIESCLDQMGRHGWIMIHDSDILLPDVLTLDELASDAVYGARRHIVSDLRNWNPSLPWSTYPLNEEGGRVLGFFQLFDASSPALRNVRPWYDTHGMHAGGSDWHFTSLFPAPRQIVLDVNVLHLGPVVRNWFGRQTERLDGSVPDEADQRRQLMDELRRRRGWDM